MSGSTRAGAMSRLRSALSLVCVVPTLMLLATPLITLLGASSGFAWLTGEEARAAREALCLSAQTSLITLAFLAVVGTPTAWWLAQRRGVLRRALSLTLMVPLLLPPSIVGLTLLEATREGGWLVGLIDVGLGPISAVLPTQLHARDLIAPFSYSAVIIAQLVVAAPLYIMGAIAAFERRSAELAEVAMCLGASPLEIWRRVTLPLIAPGLFIALSLAGARALGEFGATLLFAGNLSGYTQTAPLAIYLELERGTRGALAISIALLCYALPLLLGLAALGHRLARR